MMIALTTAAMFAAAVPFAVLAAGGGGGGGGAPTGMGNTVIETCTQDTWTCGDWGACGFNGQQTRACTKSFDCPSVDTPPAPPALRTCTPECTSDTWTCGQWGPCVGGRQRRICAKSSDCPIADTPSPATEVACRLDCGNDIWSCTTWSACASTGARTRKCTQRTDCEVPDQPSPKPTERETCTPPKPTSISPPPVGRGSVRGRESDGTPQLICGNLPTLEARVRCRIGLDEETLERELLIQYLPEECRESRFHSKRTSITDLEDQVAQRGCIDRYRKLRPCWAKPIGSERLACVRGVLGITNLREERRACEAIPPPSGITPEFQPGPSVQCLGGLRARAFPYITFRFYDLEERAEGLKELGAPMDLVVKFVVAAEQGKQDFNVARSKAERITIIRRVQSEWRAFVAALPEAVKTRARAEGVGSSY